MSLVCKFIEQIKKNNFQLSEQEKNLVLYALVKGFVDSNSKIICTVPVRDAAYFWDIDEGDVATFKHKSEALVKNFSVKIEEKKRTTYFGLIEIFRYDGKDIVISFDLNRVEQWLQNKE